MAIEMSGSRQSNSDNVDMKQQYFSQQDSWRASLTQAEKEGLFKLYGFRLQDVRELNAGEKHLFFLQEEVAPKFYIQALYKVHGFIDPEHFRDIISKLIEKNEILRTNFCRVGEHWLAVVRRQAEAVLAFHDFEKRPNVELDSALESIMEAGRRHDFDFAQDQLLRVAVYRTDERDYAVIVSQPQVIADVWDIEELFTPLFVGATEEVLLLPPRRYSFAQYLQKRSQQDKAPALRYWKKLLRELGERPRLPGQKQSCKSFLQESMRLRINHQDVLAMQAKGNDNNYLMVILSTAWGFMLQEMNRTEDTYYCLCMPERRASLANMSDMAAIMDMLPMRLQCEPHHLVRDVVQRQNSQLMLSRPYSYCHKEELKNIVGSKGELFQHLLSFHGFLAGTQSYSKTGDGRLGVVPVELCSVDGKGIDLGVYFRYDGSSITVESLFNGNSFTRQEMEVIMQQYAYTLHRMLSCWDESVYQLRRELQKRITVADGQAEAEIDELELRSFWQKVGIFHELPIYLLKDLAAHTTVRYFLENDAVMVLDKPQQELVFLLRGKAVRSRYTPDGWLRMLDIAAEKQMINETALLGDKAEETAVVLTEKAITVSLPVAYVQSLLCAENELGLAMTKYLLQEMGKYQKRWLMS